MSIHLLETRTIDALFLELAQVTKATTPKEAALQETNKDLRRALNTANGYRTADEPDCAGYWADRNGYIQSWRYEEVSKSLPCRYGPYRFICPLQLEALPSQPQ